MPVPMLPPAPPFVLDHDGYAVFRLEMLGKYACNQIGRSSGQERHHDGDVPLRPSVLSARHAPWPQPRRRAGQEEVAPSHDQPS